MILYALTIFLSAFLLFQVQPLIAKIILPWFGGSAAVWAAAMLFFQISLLAGYGYAHVLTRYVKAKTQVLIHGVLLLASCAILPILPNPTWKPTDVGDPTLRILIMLGATIGLPYFLLSSTSPLLQSWYVRKTGSSVPYRLFALSNFGSMLALLSFPFLVEPTLASRQQAYIWSGAYVLFAALCVTAAWVSREEPSLKKEEPVPVSSGTVAVEPEQTLPPAKPTGSELLLWVALGSCASILLISVTNHLSQNVAPIPLLWVLPLALYLMTFILAFESDRIYQRWLFLPWVAPALGWMAWGIYSSEGNWHIRYSIPTYLGGLFICCMLCHGELSKRKPAPQYLTLFYFMVSLGGAVGGVFVAIIAPHVFKSYLEMPIGLVFCGILAVLTLWEVEIPKVPNWMLRLGLVLAIAATGYLAYTRYVEFEGYMRYVAAIFPLICVLSLAVFWRSEIQKGPWLIRFTLAIGVGLLAGYLVLHERQDRAGYHLLTRNFYGVLRIRDDDAGEETAIRNLLHGTINHGSQRLTEEHKYDVLSYYSPTSGIGRVMRTLQEKGPVRYGVVGLGAGVMTGYAKAGDFVRVYEINPVVPTISAPFPGQTKPPEFTYFQHSAADKAVLMGDARLTMEAQVANPPNYDVLVIDAFSSDAIPVHLLTKEAFELYYKLLKPNGVLAVHISNRYLDLAPVCKGGADFVKRPAIVVGDDASETPYANSTTWVLITNNDAIFNSSAFAGANMYPAGTETTSTWWRPKFHPWTDDYSNILSILSID